MSAVARPRFFGVAAIALTAFVVIAFARTYYLRPLSDLPPLGVLMQVHGAVFTAWLLVFVVQTRLVANHRIDLHMKLGYTSVGLAVLVVAVGFAAAAGAVAARPVRPSGLTGVEFAAIPMTTITLFAVFVALGIALRRRAALHKRFMVLAMIAVLAPAASRLIAWLDLRAQATLVQLMVPALFLGWCLLADWRASRCVHAVYVIGGAVILASWPLRQMMGRTEWWQPVGEWVARAGAGLI